jgi:hypothetical protein
MSNKSSVNLKSWRHIARRLDWRFLLPDPELRSVAYLGFNEGNLFKVLKLFSESLSFIGPHNIAANTKEKIHSFDLVVAHSVSPALIKKVSELIKPNGCLYWELDRRQQWFKFSKRKNVAKKQLVQYLNDYDQWNSFVGLRNALYYVLFLQQLGLCSIELNWHRPNFDACLEIIPLGDSKALNYAFSKSRNNLAGKAKIIAGRSLKRSGLLPYVVPCFSLVGWKPLPKQARI